MAEYIERESIIAHMKDLPTWWADDGGVYGKSMKYPDGMFDCEDVIGSLEGAPAADVEPVRRGKWLKTDAYPHRVYCSECYKTYVTNEEVIQGRGWAPVYCTEAEFCPHCGAKMGGV